MTMISARHADRSDDARALDGAITHLLSLQRNTGDWEGEMVWNTMILSQHVIVRAIVGRPFDERTRQGIIRHYSATRTADGAWGMHPDSEGFVFFTTLAYVALRLLGVGPDEPLTRQARQWLRRQPGGVPAIPSWGKYWLCFIGLWEYEGVNPCPPEMYALPPWLPIHPSKYYCHTRNIYMGLAYLYGKRFRADLGPLAEALRSELFETPYRSIDFRAHRDHVAASDLFVAPSVGVRAAARGMAGYERLHSRGFRRAALASCLDRIVFEQRSTNYQALSPVNGLLDCLALFAADPNHPDLGPSLDGVEAWRWEDEALGVRYCGARSTTWDTAFAMQSLLAAPAPERFREPLLAGYRFLKGAQRTEEIPGFSEQHRDPALGGWCFSDGAHRWPVSDCTAEAVVALLEMHAANLVPAEERIAGERLRQAACFLLQRQNEDGGFGTYERRRGSAFLESINNTEMYGECMTERSYIECTASSLVALCMLRDAGTSDAVTDQAIARAVAFLRGTQRPDGTFPAFWGVQFTYSAFHVMKALRAAGVPSWDPALVRAAEWLVNHQRSDGGWGEHWSGCLTGRSVEHARSQPVMTAWALLALLEVVGPRSRAVQRGLDFLSAGQQADGGWPDDAPNGVFFGSAMLDYRLYKAYFPVWAFARAEALRQ